MLTSMKQIYLVKEEEAELARKMETKLLALPRSSGVLFVGVSVTPQIEETPAVYNVWVGCDRTFDEKLMPEIVKVTLRDEISAGNIIKTYAHRGVIRELKRVSQETG